MPGRMPQGSFTRLCLDCRHQGWLAQQLENDLLLLTRQVGEDASVRRSLESRLTDAKQCQRETCQRMLALAEALPDPRQQLLLFYRYLERQSWQLVALRLGLEVRYTMTLHRRALLQLNREEA